MKKAVKIAILSAERSGVDAERFAGEAAKFIAKPGKFKLETNSPVSFEEIVQNPLAVNASLSINGGKPFTTRQPRRVCAVTGS
ncbi:MAG: hypothetical protein LBK02_05725 [Treponema sp.]|jgi:hypothetical protein|nr:hypothetical protein [Treponema sp.]